MSFILEDNTEYEIYFSHQCDSRTFNRGAVKNIGFFAVKEKYPDHYKDINFIFNDVDTIPFNKIFDYSTTEGTVKHFYGFKYALGGIVVMKGSDFEKTNGFPCYWGWGMEDNLLQKRCEKYGIKIDRSVFYEIGSPQILQLFDGITRIINKKDPWRMENDKGFDGLSTIANLTFDIASKSENPADNIFVVYNPNIFVINIKTFATYTKFENDQYYTYDLREPPRKIIQPEKIKETKTTVPSVDNWTNIPYYPTMKQKRENTIKYLLANGQPVPDILRRQVELDNQSEINNDSFNKTTLDTIQQTNMQRVASQQPQPTKQLPIQQPVFTNPLPVPNSDLTTKQRRERIINYLISQGKTVPDILLRSIEPDNTNTNPSERTNIQIAPQIQGQLPPRYSAEYATAIGAQPRARSSANIGLGGVQK